MKKKNILFGDIIVFENKKNVKILGAVFKEGDLLYKGKKIIEILNYKVVGKTSNTKEYTEVKKSEEKRNQITGAYE